MKRVEVGRRNFGALCGIAVFGVLGLAYMAGAVDTHGAKIGRFRLVHSVRAESVWPHGAISGDGRFVAAVSDKARVWDVRSGRRVATLHCDIGDATVQGIGLSSTGRYLWSTSGDDGLEGGELELWDVRLRRRIAVVENAPVGAVTISKDESLVAYTMSNRVVVWSIRGRRRIYSEKVAEYSDVALSPRGVFVAFAGPDGVRVVDVRSKKLAGTVSIRPPGSSGRKGGPSTAAVEKGYQDAAHCLLWFSDRMTLQTLQQTRSDEDGTDVHFRVGATDLLTWRTTWVALPKDRGGNRLSHNAGRFLAPVGYSMALWGSYGPAPVFNQGDDLLFWDSRSGQLLERVEGLRLSENDEIEGLSDDRSIALVVGSSSVRWYRHE